MTWCRRPRMLSMVSFGDRNFRNSVVESAVQGSACDAGRAAAPNAGQPLLAVPRRAHLASDGGSATRGRDDEDAKRVAGGVGINPERLLLVVGAVHEHLGAQGQGALVGRVQLSPVGHG